MDTKAMHPTQPPTPPTGLRRPSPPRRKPRRVADIPIPIPALDHHHVQPVRQASDVPTVDVHISPNNNPQGNPNGNGRANSLNLMTDDDLDMSTDFASGSDKDDAAKEKKKVVEVEAIDSEISSDDEEDFRMYLRRRTPEDDVQERVVLEEVRKKRGRVVRCCKREENNLKKVKPAFPRTFFSKEAHKNIRVTLTDAEMYNDLTDMFGLKDELAEERERKRKEENGKRKRDDDLMDDIIAARGAAKKRAVTPPRHTRKACAKNHASKSKLAASRNVSKSTQAKKQKKDNGKPSDNIKKDFVKHLTKKGWSICTKCNVEVWPPNCQKHLSACPMRNVQQPHQPPTQG